MEPSRLVDKYLGTTKLMQVATVNNGKPWVCTVYFVADDNFNFYWLSLPMRRHSQEIAKNKTVAIAIAVKADLPVIGIQAEGTVEIATNIKVVEIIMELYVAKYNSGKDFYKNFTDGTNQHQLYKFTPINLVLFDEQNYPDDPQQIIKLPKKVK